MDICDKRLLESESRNNIYKQVLNPSHVTAVRLCPMWAEGMKGGLESGCQGTAWGGGACGDRGGRKRTKSTPPITRFFRLLLWEKSDDKCKGNSNSFSEFPRCGAVKGTCNLPAHLKPSRAFSQLLQGVLRHDCFFFFSF